MEKVKSQSKEGDDQVKKYLSLIKQAQNEALIQLIAEGLKSELLNSKLRVSQILIDFLKRELMRDDISEFTRLKVSEGLIPVLAGVDVGQDLFEAKLNTPGVPYEKQIQRLERSTFAIRPNQPHIGQIDLQSMSSPQFLRSLIQEYQPLLSSSGQESLEEPIDAVNAQINTKHMLKSELMGDLQKVKSIKLSDFIDEQFLDQIDGDGLAQPFRVSQRIPLSELVSSLEKTTTPIFEHYVTKRQKKDQHSQVEFLILSPLLVLTLHQIENLLAPEYKKRQTAACQLRHTFTNIQEFTYSVVYSSNQSSFTITSDFKLSLQQMAHLLLPRLLLCMLKDNVSDFEGLKVLAPVREEGLRLLSAISTSISLETQTQFLQMMPNIFRAVEKDVWHTKLNFFLLLKGLVLKADKPLKEKVLQIFGQLLINAIPNIEDEPKVAITELLQILLPTYLSCFNTPKIPTKTITDLLDNLTINLKKADEIEASAIAVFNLVCKVFEMRNEYKCLANFKYKLDLSVFAPFNFHKLEPVRISYNQLLVQVVASGSLTSYEDLSLLHTLTMQSIAMENNKVLLDTLFKLLGMLIKQFTAEDYAKYLENDFLKDSKFMSLMIAVQPDFGQFIFVESASFESIQKDYFTIVFRPANDKEWVDFYYQKMQNLTKAFATILVQGKCSNMLFDALCIRIQTLDQAEDGTTVSRTVLNTSMMQLVTIIDQYVRMFDLLPSDSSTEIIDFQYLQGLAQQMLISDDLDISLNDFWQIQLFLDALDQFLEVAERNGNSFIMDLVRFTQSCVQDFLNSQTFRSPQEQDFNGLIEQIHQLTSQQQDPQMHQAFAIFYNQYKNVLMYVQQYSFRLKATSAGIILGIARLHQNLTDQAQAKIYLNSILNSVSKPLLCQINQEKVSFLRDLSCFGLVELIQLLDHLQCQSPIAAILNICIKMIIDEPDKETQKRDEGLQIFISKLYDTSQNIYVQYKGLLGQKVLKSTSFATIKDLQSWLRLATVFANAQRSATGHKQFLTQAKALFVKLVDQALGLIKRVDFPDLSKFVVALFNDLQIEQQSRLMEILIQKLEQQNRGAFDCLDALLDDQIKFQREQGFLNYMPLFILPVIKSLSQQAEIYANDDCRIMKILAKLIQILPLNLAGLSSHNESNQELALKIKEGLDFLKVFANNQIVEDYEILIPVAAKFRTYQLEGINWMAKLGSYNLNCALCDDMGLGKTLQSLTVVLNESAKRQNKVTSLVVCPTSLTYNWLSEIKKFFKNIRAEVIDGNGRDYFDGQQCNFDILIVNYEKVKSCLPAFENFQFFYVVLDEAHKIKNSKSVVTQSVNKLRCERKLALSGTPLQNRVSELWSLFDFLMPRFLEDETTFNKTYNKYLTGNIKKMQEKLEDTQSFINALKSLKRRIAPFILRRTKEDVLKELPPKVIQDYECIMPALQYSVHQVVERTMPYSQVVGKQTNSLQNLIIHRKACNHPILVQDLLEGLPEIQKGYQHSAKLIGLLEILQDCEILQTQQEEDNLIRGEIQPHRALIFCQMQSFMDIVEQEVIQQFGIKYLQLTGSMSSKERVETVELFNSNSSYKVLLLTTAVGGLGLTLTGADVVIFVEHDWNPMKDLQAMDRAHRIGQTRTVNVYRLIVKDTIEEKIMSLQRFKENLAKSLIQVRGEGDTSLIDDQAIDLNDLLKSFEEHSIYQKQTQEPTKAAKDKKQPMTLAQVIASEGIDSELAGIQRTCIGADFEKL